MPQLSHVSLGVKSYQTSKAFYDAVLSAIRSTRIYTDDESRTLGYASDAHPDNETFTLFEAECPVASGPGVHYAFFAPDRQSVRRFWETALQMGGTDAGKWGPRSHYGEHYYAAFVLDPDGYKLEVVCQTPEHVHVMDGDKSDVLQRLVAAWVSCICHIDESTQRGTNVTSQDVSAKGKRQAQIKAWQGMDQAKLEAELQEIEAA